MSDFVKASPREPCPICGRDNWCTWLADGTLAFCMRVPAANGKVAKNGAHIHVLAEPPPDLLPVRRRRQAPEPPPLDMTQWWSDRYIRTKPEQYSALGSELGLWPEALRAVGAAWSVEDRGWAFPMWRSSIVTGIRLRTEHGKWSRSGSKAGLFLRLGYEAIGDTLYIVEGASDAPAMLQLGYPDTIGRASCRGSHDLVVAHIKRYRYRKVVIISDNDDPKMRPDGTVFYPGPEGADALLKDLAGLVQVKLVWCPRAYKDLRKWLQQGLTRKLLDTVIAQHNWRTK